MSSRPQDYKLLATELASMARELLEQGSVQDTLDSITGHAVKLINGCEAAGIMTVHRGRVHTLSATDHVALRSARAQGELDGGPCFDATTRTTRVYRIEDLHAPQPRWPRYTEQARALGVGSMMGFLLYTAGRDNLGALDIYSTRRNAFTEESEHVGWVLASHAAVALSSARQEEGLARALASSRTIGEAIGVLMSRHSLTEQAAFDVIRQASQDRNIKLRALAQTITEIGQLPE